MVRILVTNDDGIASSGLATLAAALQDVGKVYVVAPERERGAIGHAVTLHKPLRLTRMGKDIYAINGTPSDCVLLGLTQVLPRRPQLLVSGINRGLNLGDDVTYSGTVSAALEGTLLGIPSIAVSQDGHGRFSFETAAHVAVTIARWVLERGLPEEVLLNVNVPNRSRRAIHGVRMTSLSRRRFDNPVVAKVDPRGRTYYWIAGTRISWDRRKDSDYQAIQDGYVSVTPLHMDLTDYRTLEQLRDWERGLGSPTGPVKDRHDGKLRVRPKQQRPGRVRRSIPTR